MKNSQAIKNASNKANTFYQKAKEDLHREEKEERLTYQNMLQYRISKIDQESDIDKNIGYNFKDRKLTRPDWLEKKNAPSKNETMMTNIMPARKKATETFDPTVTPHQEIIEEYESLREELKLAIKSKNEEELEYLVEEAIQKYPLELEGLICHGELIMKQLKEKKRSSLSDLDSFQPSEIDIIESNGEL
ncbi:UNKNOWN [Stylonychia lemnae]|uniref:Uncharacterized protein n=1 Tax=Stylonychia lemnae TaxID=5949 RepID=A0A078AKN5_STYLE|nr:UNKNOWN [Stylonychia lemnae]|eukprot:CDW82925.1 UNKNOWN [Stylonychia lemnae]